MVDKSKKTNRRGSTGEYGGRRGIKGQRDRTEERWKKETSGGKEKEETRQTKRRKAKLEAIRRRGREKSIELEKSRERNRA